MTDLFLQLLDMGVTATFLIVAVIGLRFTFRKVPKKLICVLWALVAVRLICPVSLESAVSLVPYKRPVTSYVAQKKTAQDISQDAVHKATDSIDSINPIDYTGSEVLEADAVKTQDTKAYYSEQLLTLMAYVWITGMIGLILSGLYSYLRLKRRIALSIPCGENIYRCDAIDTPFVLGIRKPKIYIPFSLREDDLPHVIAHERAHIARRDHFIKPFAFLILTVYWFHPGVWLAYVLLCKDIELACDEKVIEKSAMEERKAYSHALLNCSMRRNQVIICPLAFGEVGVKERVSNVLHYRKTSFWVLAAVILSGVILTVCFVTSPVRYNKKVLEACVSEAILENHANSFGDETECRAEGHNILKVKQRGRKITVYALTSYGGYQFQNDNFVQVTGGNNPAVLTFEEKGETYQLKKYAVPADGADYVKTIRRMFPIYLWKRAINHSQKDIDKLRKEEEAYAKQYLKKIDRDAEIGNYADFVYRLFPEVSDTAEISLTRFGDYPQYIGTWERLEEGKRYVYESQWIDGMEEEGKFVFTKSEYKTGKMVSKQICKVDGTLSGEMPSDSPQFTDTYTMIDNKDGDILYKSQDGRLFKYLTTVTGRLSNAVKDSSFTVLTNDGNITFEKVSMSLLSSNSADWLTDTVIVEMK